MFPRSSAWEPSYVVGDWNTIAAGFCLALGVIASVPMGEAVRNRQAKKKAILGMMFVLSWVALSVSTGLGNNNLFGCMYWCFIGAITIIASMKVLWKNRKMGDTWEQEGKPNPNPVVYNLGGPLFVFGLFLFWIGMAATNQDIDATVTGSIPLYLNFKTFCAFFAGCGMVSNYFIYSFIYLYTY